MAFKLIKSEWRPDSIKHQEFILDTDADAASLPKAATGSTALAVDSGKIYVVNTTGQWVEFGTGVVVATPGAAEGGSDTLYWDGNTEGHLIVEVPTVEGLAIVKVSDAVPTMEDFANGAYFSYDNEEGISIPYDDIRQSYEENGVIMISSAFIAPTDNFDLNGMVVLPEAGVYFRTGDYSCASLTIPGYTGFPKA